MPNAKLTGKQLRFCQEYMIDRNACAAAKRAGYSKRTAHVIGPENLGKPAVAAEIAEREARAALVADVTEAEVLGYLRAHARGAKGSTLAAKLLGEHIGMWREGGPEGDGWDDLAAEANAAPSEG